MATNKWVGPGFSNFDDASNWSLGHVPTSSENAVINTGSAGSLVGSGSNEEVGSIALGSNDNLWINSGSTFWADNGTRPNVNDGTFDVSGAKLT